MRQAYRFDRNSSSAAPDFWRLLPTLAAPNAERSHSARMNVLVPLLKGCQKCNFLRNGTIIHIVRESVDCLQYGFFRAHALTVSFRILDASPAFKPNK